MPGYLVSSSAESPPSTSPSSAAYTGAVTGAHSFLKMVTIAATNPPIPPSTIHGPATDGSSAVRTWLQTQAAGTTTGKRRNAALLTVPSSVIAGAVGSRRRSAKVRAFRAGLDVRIRAMGLLEKMYGRAMLSNSSPSPEAADQVVQHQKLLE